MKITSARLFKAAVKKYGSVKAARKWVAPPGGSQHNKGGASDLSWNGDFFKNAPARVMQWVHSNAGKFDLKFPLGHEPWHIEKAETRGGKTKVGGKGKEIFTSRFELDDPGQIEMVVSAPSAADVYSKIAAPYTVDPETPDLPTMLEQARERYADDPAMLSEVERQITQDYKITAARQKQDLDTAVKGAFREIMGGTKVEDMDKSVLLKLGPEKVNKLLTLEKKFGPDGDDDETDNLTYYNITRMTPEEFAKIDLMDYAPGLSRADLRKLADKQAANSRDETGAKRSTDRTRTQIVSNAQDIMGLNPNKKPADAERMAALNRSLDEKIEAFIQANSKEPSGVEIQAMVDEMLIEGELRQWGLDPEKRLFELTPEEASRFMVEGKTVESFEDIPTEAHGEVAKTYQKIFKVAPNEDEALDLYNDIARIALGASPEPPRALKKRIEQGLLQRLGRRPTPEEVANTYRAAVVRASKE